VDRLSTGCRELVTSRLREAIRGIEAVLPELGEHLDRSVITGTTCGHEPQDPRDLATLTILSSFASVQGSRRPAEPPAIGLNSAGDRPDERNAARIRLY
jgi:hypothetical protein